MSCMSAKIRDSQVLELSLANAHLRTIGGVWATPEQEHDLLCFREIGKESIRMYVEYFIVGTCSTKVPLRLKRLQTFASRKKSDKKIKLREKEHKLVSKCMRRQLAWSAHTQCIQQHRGEQYLELPRALCTHDALPHKGQKSYATKFLEARYCDLILYAFPAQWLPEVVILEGH